jgi:hypothetical protein
MSRFLALDGDQPILHVASANVIRGSVRIDKAICINEGQAINLANAATLGKNFRQHLKEAGITPAPVLVSLGRERIVLKEIKFPPVPDSEEANIVRFQVSRDLSEAPENVVIDYFPIPYADATAERKALTVVVRREIIQAYEKFCTAAGLKLMGITPRPFASVAGIQRAVSIGAVNPVELPNASYAVLTRGDKWGELTIARGDSVVFTRSLSGPALNSETALLGELKRNLAVYSGQNPQSPVQTVYMPEADGPGGWSGRIRSGMTIPVQSFDPLAGVLHEATPESRANFAALSGLFDLQSREQLPINFLKPREPKKQADPNKRFLLTVVPLLLLLFAGAFIFGLSIKADKERKLVQLQELKKELDDRLPKLEEDEKRVKYVNEWRDRTVVWLDEIYDLTARFPDVRGTQLLEFKAFAREPAKNEKTKMVARMEVKIQTESSDAIKALQSELVRDRFYKVEPWKSLGTTGGGNSLNRFNQVFELKTELEHRNPKEYTRKLNVTPYSKLKPPVDEGTTPPTSEEENLTGLGGER